MYLIYLQCIILIKSPKYIWAVKRSHLTIISHNNTTTIFLYYLCSYLSIGIYYCTIINITTIFYIGGGSVVRRMQCIIQEVEGE